MATARKLPSGSWRVRQYIGEDASGKKLYKSFTASTKKEAEFAAAEYVLTRKEKTAPVQMTVGEAIDRYIAARSEVLSPSTIRGYKLIRKNNLQGLMGVQLGDLTQEAVQLEINAGATTHSPKTLQNAHGLLVSALEAYRPDFALRTKLPQKTRHEISVPDKSDVDRLVAATKGTVMEIVIILGAVLGLRRSEICALTWDDIDFENKRIQINKALVRNSENGWTLKAPKSYAGTRELDMPEAVSKRLKQLDRSTDRIVPLPPSSIGFRFTRLVNRLGLDIHLHSLRHYNASVMLALGVPDKYAMKRMGHATPDMLKNVYQHVMRDKQEEVDAKVSTYFQDV